MRSSGPKCRLSVLLAVAAVSHALGAGIAAAQWPSASTPPAETPAPAPATPAPDASQPASPAAAAGEPAPPASAAPEAQPPGSPPPQAPSAEPPATAAPTAPPTPSAPPGLPPASGHRPPPPPPPPHPPRRAAHYHELQAGPSPRLDSWIGAGVALGVLNLPKLGAGIKALGELRSEGMWPIDIGVVYFFDNQAALDRDELDLRANPLLGLAFPASGSSLHVDAVQASVAACPYERDLRPGILMLCAGVQGGLMHVRAEGFMSHTDGTHGLFAIEGYARWHFRIKDAFGASYSAGLFVPFMRDRFGYIDRFGGFNSTFRVGAVGGRLDLMLTYGF